MKLWKNILLICFSLPLVSCHIPRAIIWNKPDYKSYPRKDAYTSGLLGNYIYLLPEKDVIIVRLGKKERKIKYSKKIKRSLKWGQIFYKISTEI